MSIKIHHTLVIALLLAILPSHSVRCSVHTDSLSQNAYSIVQKYSAVFSQTDINNATYTVTKIVTILDKKGAESGNFYTFGDRFVDLKDFSGVVRNASGEEVKKLGKKDLTISSMSDQTVSDNYSIYYECQYPTYPYTVEYSYQQKWKNGIIGYPRFYPMNGYTQAVAEADYRIELPANMNLRYKSNSDCTIKEETAGDKHIYTFSVKQLKAIEHEPLAPYFKEIGPVVLIAPSDFCYDGVCGNMSTWNSYGTWVSTLLKDRDNLPLDLVNKAKALTLNAGSEKEKVEILYKYLQANSRYVSIQLGIGGFQPTDAASVAKSNFGDCKGLTNWMRALLKAVDIPSNYCEIQMGGNRRFEKDFSNITQTNHAILLVPLANDSIWLECTSQTLPFGYIHNGIAGHDALVVTADGAKVCRVPSYKDSDNKEVLNMVVDIAEDGTATGNIRFTEYLHNYDNNVRQMKSNDKEQQLRFVHANAALLNAKITDITVVEDRSPMPSCTFGATFSTSDFANKTGSRLFVPICPLKTVSYNGLTSNIRKMDIVINDGYVYADSVTIRIPAGYTPETLPKNITISTPYGKLTTHVVFENNEISYMQQIEIFSGRYNKSEYNDIKTFFAEIASNTKRKVVLKKT